MSDLAAFTAFYKTFLAAGVARDAAFARTTLPPNLPDDHFAFLLEMRAGMAEAITESKAAPQIEAGSDKMIVRYDNIDDGDGGTSSIEMPFYAHNGSWVTYDPTDPELS
jgi:hypothetical protein